MKGLLDFKLILVELRVVVENIPYVQGYYLVKNVVDFLINDQVLEVLLPLSVNSPGLLHEVQHALFANIKEHFQSVFIQEVHDDDHFRKGQTL